MRGIFHRVTRERSDSLRESVIGLLSRDLGDCLSLLEREITRANRLQERCEALSQELQALKRAAQDNPT